ncbi:thymidylate kinase [Besnoitia besnoiti]|uniref:dTMP kinase n=1 Tax=Besnoitia besnoiti TaxID=94643 RepID=A0A2A9MF13_BESBE|nr:thymidylate kinase [Besnoitia besnoiti]PFH33960.1 thymidylate kinase [Besnoitia besnoiti]
MKGFTPKRGCFVVFEGIDRSGKSTQARLAYERLVKAGYPSELLRFPDRTTSIGKVLNSYLTQGTEHDDKGVSEKTVASPQLMHLLFAANRWETQARLLRALGEGKVVVADRYSFSGIAYTVGAAPVVAQAAAREAEARAGKSGEPADVAAACALVTAATGSPFDGEFCRASEQGLLAPDAVFYLDITPEEAQKRGGYGDELYEQLAVQERVHGAYKQFEDLPYWRRIPAGVSPEALHEKIAEELKLVIQQTQPDQPLKAKGDAAGSDGRKRLWEM